MMLRAHSMARCLWLAVAGLSLLVTAALAGACASQAAPPAVANAEDSVRIQVGQRISVEGGALEILFEAVTADSRCPKGENCAWEGDAVVALVFRSGDRPPTRLEVHTSAKGPSAVAYLNWAIRLAALEPYPVTGRTIPPADYVAILVVGRGQPDDFSTQ
jgi:hypothetical protein